MGIQKAVGADMLDENTMASEGQQEVVFIRLLLPMASAYINESSIRNENETSFFVGVLLWRYFAAHVMLLSIILCV